MTIMTTAPMPVTSTPKPPPPSPRRTPPDESLAVLAARLADTLHTSVTRFLNAADQNLGHLEVQAAHDVQSLLRETLRRAALGLEDTVGYSPGVQAMLALAASKLTIADASLVLEHLSGVQMPPATLAREAKRQGQRAQAQNAPGVSGLRLHPAPDRRARPSGVGP